MACTYRISRPLITRFCLSCVSAARAHDQPRGRAVKSRSILSGKRDWRKLLSAFPLARNSAGASTHFQSGDISTWALGLVLISAGCAPHPAA